MASFQNFWHLQALKNSLADGEPLDVLLKDALCLLLGPGTLIRLMQLPLSPLSKGQAGEGKQRQSQVTKTAGKTSAGTKVEQKGQHKEWTILVSEPW